MAWHIKEYALEIKASRKTQEECKTATYTNKSYIAEKQYKDHARIFNK